MTQKDTSGPAFPCDRVPLLDGTIVCAPGITARDYFAAKAMQAFIMGIDNTGGVVPVRDERVAERSYEVADAMLEEREK